MPSLRVLTWHVHGSYLYDLAQTPHEFWLPVQPGRPEGYGGRSGSFRWPDNVHEIAADDVRSARFDVVLFQSRRNYEVDAERLLSDAQRRLPRIYLEHDPPREHPTDTRHPAADDPGTLIVHVTPFNALMWDNGVAPVSVVEHGVVDPGARWTGELERGIVVVNDLAGRGRRLGRDVFEQAAADVPLDLVGMRSEALGGLGEIAPPELPGFEARYRFFFHPIRYTSLGLAVCEAMMLGMPVVGLATTELATVVENGESGYVDTDVRRLVPAMRELLADRRLAARLGEGARRRALERFSIDRFARDWDAVFREVAGSPSAVFAGSGSASGATGPAGSQGEGAAA